MAMSVVYGNFGGSLVSENRGGVERDYVSDTLGSTASLLDSSGVKTDEWTYWPYGETRTRTGTSTTPFTFVGTLGYFADNLKRLYVRARHYLTDVARWLVVDPLWPDELAYCYVRGRAVDTVDPFGLSPRQHPFGPGFTIGIPKRQNPLLRLWELLKSCKVCEGLIGIIITSLLCLLSVINGESAFEQCVDCCQAFANGIGVLIGLFTGNPIIGAIIAALVATAGSLACGPICEDKSPDCLPADPIPTRPTSLGPVLT